jgi:hypothetical protein
VVAGIKARLRGATIKQDELRISAELQEAERRAYELSRAIHRLPVDETRHGTE